MTNRFVFIVPFFNAKKFIKECADSLISQNYKNWVAIFCDDASTDGTVDNIPEDDRFFIKILKNRVGGLMNIHMCIVESMLEDDDIICILDGDDKLLINNSINIINDLYDDNTLLTYGQYITSYGKLGHSQAYTKESFSKLRKIGFITSHIKTFKYKLYKEFLRLDPNLDQYKDDTGNWYNHACDVAKMIPLIEIAGFDKIKFNPIPIYYYRIHNNNIENTELQKKNASHIFSKPSLNKFN
jgi:glycosyltransferase involved in cell wall biosynthesis